MNDQLNRLLDCLSETVDAGRQAKIAQRYQRALDYQAVDRPPVAVSFPFPEEADFQPFPHHEVFDDPDKMLFNELVHAFDLSIVLNSKVGCDLPTTVRANFGTVLIASMFGANVEQLDDNPPWVVHDPDDEISLQQILERDPSDVSQGWIPRAAERMQAYHERLKPYTELRKCILIVQPDLQGPFDNLELLCGSGVFLDLLTNPQAVDQAMERLAAAQVAVFNHLDRWTTEPARGFCHQHGVMMKGNILLRNDSCIMVSPEMYREQIAPHDERVLRDCGGGGLHACGSADHLVDEFLALEGLQGIDLGQPELNDVERLYAKARQQNAPLLRMTVTPEEVVTGRFAEQFPTGAVLLCRAESLVQARSLGLLASPTDSRNLT
jgi:hypothetical protein